MRLIDADALCDECGPSVIKCVGTGCRVPTMPTIEAEPVRHGRWISVYGGSWVKCSECECHWQSGIIEHCNVSYCPNCGCKMDGDSHD